ncbi:hypothetical protein ACQKM5_19695, partial [Kitasatospora sp. NPDC001175]
VTNAAALDDAGLAPWIRTPGQLAPRLREALRSTPARPAEAAVPADHVIAALAGATAAAPGTRTAVPPALRRGNTRELAS